MKFYRWLSHSLTGIGGSALDHQKDCAESAELREIKESVLEALSLGVVAPVVARLHPALVVQLGSGQATPGLNLHVLGEFFREASRWGTPVLENERVEVAHKRGGNEELAAWCTLTFLVPVYASPMSQSRRIAGLPFSLIEADELLPEGWIRVKLGAEEVGYIRREAYHKNSRYRIGLRIVEGVWWITHILPAG